MHRSGTSVLTRLVSLLGFEVGDDDLLMGAASSNRTGHWEITHLTELNNLLLDHLGGRWSGPPAVDAAAQRSLVAGEWGARARKGLHRAFRGTDWVWKDPRVCVLLPFWRTVLDERQPRVILAVRHPMEVARSLTARDGFGADYGLALWERYHRSALAGIAGLPACVVSYDDLLDDPAAVAATIQRFLEVDRPPVDPADIAGAVDVAQRHQVAPAQDRLPTAVTELLEQTDAVRGTHPGFPQLDLPPETAALQVAFDEHTRLSPYHDLWAQIRPLADEAVALREEAAALRAELDRLESALPVRAWRRLRGRPRSTIGRRPTVS
jgi:hypothetical protein